VGTLQNARFPITVDGSVPTGALNGSSGATLPRTQGDRLGGWLFDVKDFGAVGDSDVNASTGTDDTDAIQAAVAAVEASGGGIIFFPAGTYKVTAPITFLDNTVYYTFRGVGNAGLSGGTIGGSCVVGNYAGFIFERDNLNTSGARVSFEHLGIRNAHASGGAIHMIGTKASNISWCAIQARTWGIKMGGKADPEDGTFTASSSGTTLTASAILTGSIDTDAFPLPISGTGVPLDTRIMSQSSGTPGGAGDYITDVATTCSSNTVTTHPNAPTDFTSGIEHCVINGGGTYNADPDLSFTGVGVQLSTNSFIRECHLNNWGTAVRTYGVQNGIYACQMESNTNGVVIGLDAEGNIFSTSGCAIIGLSLESNYRGIWIRNGLAVSIQNTYIQVTVDGSHNSLYGILVDAIQSLKIEATTVSGTLDTGGFGLYLSGSAGAMRRIRAEACDLKSVSKDASVNYSCMTAVQSVGVGVLSCTLAQLNTAISAGDVVPGENRFITDANVALGSQTYGAVVTGGSSNFARVYWDSADVRYG
jgi:hypothetical protein